MPPRPLIVFDVLGMLVDQAGSLRSSVAAATGWNEVDADHLVTRWLDDVATRERKIIAGDAEFAPSQDLDAAALAQLVADGALSAHLSAPLASASRKLEPWPDSVEGLARLAEDMIIGGLSNAGLRTAYVPRPGGDSPNLDDDFDIYATDLADLHTQLLS